MDDSSKLGCVFRRPERPPGKRQGYVWYAAGVSGCMSTQGGELGMLADHSVLVVPQADDSRPAGRQLRASFHHLRQGEVCFSTPRPVCCMLIRRHGGASCEAVVTGLFRAKVAASLYFTVRTLQCGSTTEHFVAASDSRAEQCVQARSEQSLCECCLPLSVLSAISILLHACREASCAALRGPRLGGMLSMHA